MSSANAAFNVCLLTDNARVDFEPASAIIGDEHDYIKIYDSINALHPGAAADYALMCYFDGLVYNRDRHENNFGLLRDSDTGEILGLAPFFDHNIALVSGGYPKNAPGDMLITDVAPLMRHLGQPPRIRELTRKEIVKLVRDIPYALPPSPDVPDPKAFVADYLLRRQAVLKEQNRYPIL